MTVMVISDIHGSARYCREALEAFDREGADKLLILGDVLYHGPRNPLPEDYAPQTVAALLNARREQLLCIRGNCDAEVDQMMLDFPVLTDYAWLTLGNRCFYAAHGHHASAAALPPLGSGEVFLQGHTHVPAWEQAEGHWCLNPGSVSLPKEESPRGYLLLREDGAEWKTLTGERYHRLSF